MHHAEAAPQVRLLAEEEFSTAPHPTGVWGLVDTGAIPARPGRWGIPRDLAHSLPEHLAMRYKLVPLGLDANTLHLGMADPCNLQAIDDIRLITGFDIDPIGLSEQAVMSAMTTGDCDLAVEELKQQGRAEILTRMVPIEAGGPLPVLPGDAFLRFPLRSLEMQAHLSGPLASVQVRQRFGNANDHPIEARYIFPLPSTASVHAFRIMVGERVLEGQIHERGRARQTYAEGVHSGHRAALVEQERENVFTVSVGNLPPGEDLTVELGYVERLGIVDDQTIFRFPLVVAPRYVPGLPVERASQGWGTEPDTDQVPDASRIPPPRLHPDVSAGATLHLAVHLQTGGRLPLSLACSQHVVAMRAEGDGLTLTLAREREVLDRDFVLSYQVLAQQAHLALLTSLTHFLLSVYPPALGVGGVAATPRDVVVLLDRSGSMEGAKIESARRAVLGFLDTLQCEDRFALVAFDSVVETFDAPDRAIPLHPLARLPQARSWLATIDSRGGTQMAEPLRRVLDLHAEPGRLLCVLVITDGQVGNESALLAMVQGSASKARLFTLGIDTAVNDSLLRELARLGRGTCELVTPGEPLEASLGRLAREIGHPRVTDLEVVDRGLGLVPESLVPWPLPDLFQARPVHVLGARRGSGGVEVRGRLPGTGGPWVAATEPVPTDNPALAILWARDRIRALEDRLRLAPSDRERLEGDILALALEHRLLTNDTAFAVVDRSQIVADGWPLTTVVQPVHLPAGWSEPGSEPGQCFQGFADSMPCLVAYDEVKEISAGEFGALECDEEEEPVSLDRLKDLVDEQPIVRVTNLILAQAVRDGASHFHLEAEERCARVRHRVDGVLHDIMAPPKHVYPALVARFKIMAGLDLAVSRRPQSGTIILRHEGRVYVVEVSTCPSRYGERLVARLRCQDRLTLKLDSLNLTADELQALCDRLDSRRGWLVVAGPASSGRSTTLLTCAHGLNTGAEAVLVWDDRAQNCPGMQFLQGPASGGETGVVAAMRAQDPDVLVLGSLDSVEDARQLAMAVREGHLALSGLTAPDPLGALWRLSRFGGEVASEVSGLLFQVPVRSLCENCRYQEPKDESAWRSRGCDDCRMTGYRGSAMVATFLPFTDPLRQCLAGCPTRVELRGWAVQIQNRLQEAAERLVRAGRTSANERHRVVDWPEDEPQAGSP